MKPETHTIITGAIVRQAQAIHFFAKKREDLTREERAALLDILEECRTILTAVRNERNATS